MSITSSALVLGSAATDADYGWLGNAVVAVMEAIGPAGVGLAVFAENIFPPIPSEVILPLAGFTAAGGAFTAWQAVLFATAGSVLGALVLYGVGAAIGRRRMYRIADWLPLVDLDDVVRTETWFARHGYWTVLFGRMVPVFRSLISIPAGIERMNLGLFTLCTLVGSLAWNSLFIYAGFFLGENFSVAGDVANTLSTVVMVLIVGALALWIVLRLRRNRRRAQDPDYRPLTPDEAAARMDAALARSDYGKPDSV
ncbi:MAG: DedA family protein [Micrococcus sp.]|nr:DedA family protein [Micrococcus sp.]